MSIDAKKISREILEQAIKLGWKQYNRTMKTIYCVHPISGLSADEVFAYYTKIKKNLSNHYNVMIPMTGKSSLRCTKEFRCEGYKDNPLTTNHAIFERDRWMVTQSDIIYANLIGATEKVSIGSMFELAWASLLGKYVVLVMDKESIHRHAFVMEAADVIFESEQVAEDYLITLANGTI
jgi:nucleoside 2-deoxyribosyltransferase